MTSSKTRIALLAIIAVSAGLSTQAQAQETLVALAAPVRPAAAVEMELLADDLVSNGRGMERAAGVYRAAAEMRGVGDMRSADNLRLAGYLQFYNARSNAAIVSLTQAGEIFLAHGDVAAAAQAFIDGAWVAAQAGMPMEAKHLSERGRLLARSPLLRAAERTALERRLGVEAGIQ